MAHDDDSIDSITAGVVEAIREAGYSVSVSLAGGMVAMYAKGLHDGTEHFARVTDGNAPEDQFAAACALAESVGLELME